ncbi:MAG: hypothetical protein R3E83_15170 [Burkholderiaceae bacterium]
MTDAFRDLQAFEAWGSNGALIERHAIPMGPGGVSAISMAAT